MLTKAIVTLTAICGGAVSLPVAAQSNGEAVIYSRALFKGAQRSIYGPTRAMGEFVVKSIQIPPNSAWELCTGNTFTGCKKFTHSLPSMVMTVRSARPVALPIPASATFAGGPVKGSDASLRGLASEFFVMPQEGGNRIEVVGSAGAGERATEFCRTRGWRTAAYSREQTVQGRRYLADVLCADEAR